MNLFPSPSAELPFSMRLSYTLRGMWVSYVQIQPGDHYAFRVQIESPAALEDPIDNDSRTRAINKVHKIARQGAQHLGLEAKFADPTHDIYGALVMDIRLREPPKPDYNDSPLALLLVRR